MSKNYDTKNAYYLYAGLQILQIKDGSNNPHCKLPWLQTWMRISEECLVQGHHKYEDPPLNSPLETKQKKKKKKGN